MSRGLRFLCALLLSAAMVVFALPGSAANADGNANPTITSDQADYAPGSTVTLTGAGWSAAESVHVTVDDNVGQSWHFSGDVTADDAGAFTEQLTLPNWFVATYDVQATGSTGDTASTTFTDSNVQVSALNTTPNPDVKIAVPITWSVFRKDTSCTGTTRTTGTVTTVTTGNGFTGTSGVGQNTAMSLRAQNQVVVGTELFTFSGWTGDLTGSSNIICVPGNLVKGSIQETANYVDSGPTTQLAQTITFGLLPDKTIGDPDFTVSATASSGLPVSFSASPSSVCTISGTTVHLVAQGDCTITATQGGNATYLAATPVPQSFSVLGQALTVTATGSQTYGSSTPAFHGSIPSTTGVTLDDSALTCTTVNGGTAIAPTLAVTGSYTLDSANCSGATISGTNAGTYALVYSGSTFTVNPASINVTVTGGNTYGQSSSFSSTVLPAGVSGSVTCTSTTDPKTIDSSLAVGNYTIDASTCSGLSTDSNHTVNYIGGSYGVTAAQLTVTATGSQTYGSSSPAFHGSIPSTTNVTLDDSSLACTTVNGGTAISSTLAAGGSYTIDPLSCTGASLGGSDASNYTFVYGGGAFTVNPAPIDVTVTGGNTYGQSPSFSSTVLPSGVTGTATCTSTTDPKTINSSLDAGSYTIDPSTCSGLHTDSNHSVNYLGGSYVVSQAQLTLTATGSQTYGSSSPTFHGSIPSTTDVSVDDSALVCTTVNSGTAIAATLAVAGPYTIDPLSCTGATLTGTNSSNYTFVMGGGAFTVDRAAITVTVNGTQVYGGTPNYAIDSTGVTFANSDTSAVLNAPTGCTTNATVASSVGGSYWVKTCSVTAANYSVTVDDGTLTVLQAPITVTVNGSQVYGGSPTYTTDSSGVTFFNGDTAAAVLSAPSGCTTNATATSAVGSSYYVHNCQITATNYNVTVSNGTLTVTQKPITVTVNATQVYGGTPNYATDASGVTDWVGTDSATVLSTPSGCTTNATAASSVGGSYWVKTCSITATNYSVTVNDGTLTVLQAPITVTVNGSQVYGGSPTYTTNSSGVTFFNGDTAAGVLSAPSGCTTNATAASPVVGSYWVKTCSITATNYSVTVNDGTLTVTKAHLTVTADAQHILYGDPLPNPYTATLSGYVLGQTLGTSGVSGTAACSSTATTSSGAGNYTIHCTQGSLTAANYDFTPFVDGTLQIGARNATLTYTAPLFWSTGSSTGTSATVNLTAQLSAPAGDLTKGAPITFYVFNSSNLSTNLADANYTCPANTVTAGGVAACSLSLGLDSYTVIVHLNTPNAFFSAPNSDPVVITVYQPGTGSFATGGGWITDPSVGVSTTNKHGNFGFTVRYAKNGSSTPSGQAVFVWRGTDGYDYVVKSNSWQNGSLAFPSSTGTAVGFNGKANVTVVNPATGMAVAGLGGGNYTFRVDATDNGSPGSSDSYAITVYSPNGNAIYHQAGTPTQQIVLGGGNIVVHAK